MFGIDNDWYCKIQHVYFVVLRPQSLGSHIIKVMKR